MNFSHMSDTFTCAISEYNKKEHEMHLSMFSHVIIYINDPGLIQQTFLIMDRRLVEVSVL